MGENEESVFAKLIVYVCIYITRLDNLICHPKWWWGGGGGGGCGMKERKIGGRRLAIPKVRGLGGGEKGEGWGGGVREELRV